MFVHPARHALICVALVHPVRRRCVGMCECLPDRDFGDDFVSIHFSCIPMSLHKPGWYSTHEE